MYKPNACKITILFHEHSTNSLQERLVCMRWENINTIKNVLDLHYRRGPAYVYKQNRFKQVYKNMFKMIINLVTFVYIAIYP